ncbi:MAG: CoA ester lyase [Rhizobiaceae bacterium]|nr:CoA ester lyase [Rhizobiaceae bacterium]
MTANPSAVRYDLPLFVPANKPERLPKALAAAHDAVIIDLEDAVAAADKEAARNALFHARSALQKTDVAVFVRVNAIETQWHAVDIGLCAELPLAGIMLPKSESGAQIDRLRSAIPERLICLALVETAKGIDNLQEIATRADRLAFGSIDYCVDLGCGHDRLALLGPRQACVTASKLAGLPAPLDGVTTTFRDVETVRDDAAHAAMLGFGGKMLIHPAQIEPARTGLAPSPEMVAWANRILAAGTNGATALDGMMIDEPVLLRAQGIRARAKRTDTQLWRRQHG